MDYKEVGETASKLLVYAKDMGLPEEIRGEMHAAAIMLFGVEEALRAAEAAEARAEKAERERDILIKWIHGECWSCVRRYDCNSRLGPHRKCWEFDQSILQRHQGNSTC